ncbi:hypothetical protein GXP67_29520 [Rhodocytophaga rosea]|uniref:Chloride channel protein n=1 Tax=Rhodocytophaga rosea TaxID=2704465 RepID=A0A6C0GR04_9BACT|nr:hypothetical protein [Rhodocytophaga rosea]QHT70496.1 hypothetical protein GXP67_29520 [Rhodocytophaga rosea]
MRNFIAICIITFACLVGSFLGITVYELVNHLLISGKWSFQVLSTDLYLTKVVAILSATLIGAIGQELIIPIQHKFTFWRYIRQKGMVGFTILAGSSLAIGGSLAIAISVFMTQKISLAEFFVNDYASRCLSILPAAFIFGACYGLGRFKSYEQKFGNA